MRNDKFDIVPAGSLRPYEGHARNHSGKKLAKLRRLVAAFGQVAPIVVDGKGTIIDGHALWRVLRELDYDEVAVAVVSGRSDPEIRALRLALNRLPQDAKWDDEKLRSEFQSLIDLSFDLDLTGFEAPEIDLVLEVDIPKANVIEDETIPALQEPVSLIGDVWLCGKHRIGCCDALDAAAVSAVMGEAKAAMVFTDPPYNVPIEGFVSGMGGTRHAEFLQASGEMTEAEFTAFLTNAIRVQQSNVRVGASMFVCMDWRHVSELLSAAKQNAAVVDNICVWVKTNAGMGSLYRSQHELVFVLRNGTGGSRRNNVELGKHGRNRSNVWTYRGMNAFGSGRDELLASHPTVKPVLMIADAIRDVTKRGEIVLDTFLGSGSTLMAAEETGRLCYGSDLEPRYVDVAVRRCKRGRDVTPS